MVSPLLKAWSAIEDTGVSVDDALESIPTGSFISIQLADGREVVGAFEAVAEDDLDEPVVILRAPNGAEVQEFIEAIEVISYAPMGYRVT